MREVQLIQIVFSLDLATRSLIEINISKLRSSDPSSLIDIISRRQYSWYKLAWSVQQDIDIRSKAS